MIMPHLLRTVLTLLALGPAVTFAPAADEAASRAILPAVTSGRAVEPEVMKRFNTYSEAMHELTDPRQGLDERLRGNYGRFPVLTIKLSLILTLMDWVEDGAKGSPRISLAHWACAQILTEAYRASAHRLLAELNVSQDVRNEQKIMDFIARFSAERPPSKRDIHRGTGIKNRKEAYAAVEALLESGAISESERRNSHGGRPTRGYEVAESD